MVVFTYLSILMHLQIRNFGHILRDICIIILIIPLNILSVGIFINNSGRNNIVNTITSSIHRKFGSSYLKLVNHIIGIYRSTITVYNNMLPGSQSHTTIPISIRSLKNILPFARTRVNSFNNIHTGSTRKPSRCVILHWSGICRIPRSRRQRSSSQSNRVTMRRIYTSVLNSILNILQYSDLGRTFARGSVRRIILHRRRNLRKTAKRYIAHSSKRNGCLEYN